MDLSRFNALTQYLKRDVLMGTLKHYYGDFEKLNYDEKYEILLAVSRNPNFELKRYVKAFPNIKWDEYVSYPPLFQNELNDLINAYDHRKPLPDRADLILSHGIPGAQACQNSQGERISQRTLFNES